jgi:hypothetical protein
MREGSSEESASHSKKIEHGEFEVRLSGKSEIYFTDDPQDAVDTGLVMGAKEAK